MSTSHNDDLRILFIRHQKRFQEVAAYLGVHPGTVSHLMTGKYPLKPQWRDGIAEFIQESPETVQHAYDIGKANHNRAKNASNSGTTRHRRSDPAEARAIAS